MKIKKIEVENNEILGSLKMDFCKKDGTAADVVYIAGENGSGKSTLLNNMRELLYLDFTSGFSEHFGGGTWKVLLELGQFEKKFIHKKISNDYSDFNFNEIEIVLSEMNNWEFSLLENRKSVHSFSSTKFGSDFYNLRELFTCFYIDDSSISEEIKTDHNRMNNKGYDRFSRNIGGTLEKINSLLVDISDMDSGEAIEWLRSNPNSTYSCWEDQYVSKINKFQNAFNNMFSNKKLLMKSRGNDGDLKVVFKEFGREMSIDELSTGEKRIIWMGGMILNEPDRAAKSLIFIEEPENNLHPNWQLRIIDYYKAVSEQKENHNQIIVTTHSPFLLHSHTNNDSVVVLEKVDGKIQVMDSNQFYGFTKEKIINQAYNIDFNQFRENSTTLIMTEGKTDWKHLKAALWHFQTKGQFNNLNIRFFEYEENIQMGEARLERLLKDKVAFNENYKIIGVYDRDSTIGLKHSKEEYNNIGGDVYSFCIPTPEFRKGHNGICIEMLYENKTLTKENASGRRMFISSEFDEKKGTLHNDEKIIIGNIKKIKGKTEKNNEVIITDDIRNLRNGDTIALSKNDFANNILSGYPEYSDEEFLGFKDIFTIIEKIENI